MEDLNVAWMKKYRTKNEKRYIYKDKKHILTHKIFMLKTYFHISLLLIDYYSG